MERCTEPCRPDESSFLFTEGMNFFDLEGDGSFLGDKRPGVVQLCERSDLSGSWLDLGSGDGRYTDLLLKRCSHVTALDADRSALSKLWHRMGASARFRLTTVVHNVVEPLPFTDGSLDGVLCIGLLHYFPEDRIRRVLDEMLRVLRPGATLLLELSTEVERMPVEGERTPLRRGFEHGFARGRTLLAEHMTGRCAFELFDEKVGPTAVTLRGRPYTWTSRDVLMRATKFDGSAELRSDVHLR